MSTEDTDGETRPSAVEPWTRDWVRAHWDDQHGTAPRAVLFAKLLHEWHIGVPGFVAAVVVGWVFWLLDADAVYVVASAFTAFGGGYALFYPSWWCSTVTRG